MPIHPVRRYPQYVWIPHRRLNTLLFQLCLSSVCPKVCPSVGTSVSLCYTHTHTLQHFQRLSPWSSDGTDHPFCWFELIVHKQPRPGRSVPPASSADPSRKAKRRVTSPEGKGPVAFAVDVARRVVWRLSGGRPVLPFTTAALWSTLTPEHSQVL